MHSELQLLVRPRCCTACKCSCEFCATGHSRRSLRYFCTPNALPFNFVERIFVFRSTGREKDESSYGSKCCACTEEAEESLAHECRQSKQEAGGCTIDQGPQRPVIFGARYTDWHAQRQWGATHTCEVHGGWAQGGRYHCSRRGACLMHTWRVLRHWVSTSACQHYTNRHHQCQSLLLCAAQPPSHLGCKGPNGHTHHGIPTCSNVLIDIKRSYVDRIYSSSC